MDVNSMAILILLGSFFLMIMLRFPIAYAVALSSVFCLMAQGLPLTTICQQMVKGISSFSLMAVPFFITMGCLMGKHRCILFLWWYFRFCICRYCFLRIYSDPYDG